MKTKRVMWRTLSTICLWWTAITANAQGYTITVAEQQNCTVEVSPLKETYQEGDEIFVKLTHNEGATFNEFEVYYECTEAEWWEAKSSDANEGLFEKSPRKLPRRVSSFAYRLEIWELDDHEDDPVEIDEGERYSFTMPARNVEIEAIFLSDEVTFEITKTPTEHGLTVVYVDPPISGIMNDATSAAAGKVVNISATPDTGYSVDDVLVYEQVKAEGVIYESLLDVDKVDNQLYSFTMPANPVRVMVTYRVSPTTLTLYDNADNNKEIKKDDGMTLDVTLSGRTLYRDESWNTLCLPFNIDDFNGTILDDATVKRLESASYAGDTKTLTLNFADANAIEAGVPYFVKWPGGHTDYVNPVFYAVKIVGGGPTVETKGVVSCQGLYAPLSVKHEDRTILFMGADNTLYYPNTAMTIGSFRAYFSLIGISAGDLEETESSVSNFVLNFDGTTTDISLTPRLSPLTSDYYTLDGRRVNGIPTQKGVYIHNGRIVMVK